MPRVTVLVSDRSQSALHQRALALFRRLPDQYESTIVCHEGDGIRRTSAFLNRLRATEPDLIYVLDPIYAAVTAISLYRRRRRVPVVLDTGDLVYELATEVGGLSPPALWIVRWSEHYALRTAQWIVVRGEYHRDWLARRGVRNVSVIPDGVDLRTFFPTAERPWRERLDIAAHEIVVGGVGSIIWNARHDMCFGWELVEALAHLSDLPVRGVLIGDGDGLVQLQRRAKALGVSGRLVFAGHVALDSLNGALNALDIALLTAPNTEMSQVRTTGKLPLYLACDRYVIATPVGTAARLLAPFDMLLPYCGGGRDETYPPRLANKVRALLTSPTALQLDGRGVALARAHFDYDHLASRLYPIVNSIV